MPLRILALPAARRRALATAAEGPAYVVFGATGGIGSELARQLHAAGGRLLLVGRDSAKLDALAASLPGALAAPCANAAAPGEAEAAVNAAVARFGRVDGVANCVGSVILKAAHQTSDAELAAVMETNLGTSFSILRAAVKAMTKPGHGGGSIVLCSSAVARFGLPNHEAIAAAKGAVAALALSAGAPRGGLLGSRAAGRAGGARAGPRHPGQGGPFSWLCSLRSQPPLGTLLPRRTAAHAPHSACWRDSRAHPRPQPPRMRRRTCASTSSPQASPARP